MPSQENHVLSPPIPKWDTVAGKSERWQIKLEARIALNVSVKQLNNPITLFENISKATLFTGDASQMLKSEQRIDCAAVCKFRGKKSYDSNRHVSFCKLEKPEYGQNFNCDKAAKILGGGVFMYSEIGTQQIHIGAEAASAVLC